jgi:hypothetical protein
LADEDALVDPYPEKVKVKVALDVDPDLNSYPDKV